MKSIRPYLLPCAIAVAIAAIAAIAFSVLAPSKYGAEMSLAVGDKNGVVSPELGDQAQAITNTIAQLIRSNAVATQSIRLAKLETSPSTFLKNLKTEQKPDAAVLAVSYKGSSKEQAVKALAALNIAFQAQFAKVGADIKPPKKTTAAGAEIQQPLQVKVRVFDPPHALEKKVSPRPVRNLGIAILLGLMIAVFWTAFREAGSRRDEPGHTPPPTR